jgi:hypothetical protein
LKTETLAAAAFIISIALTGFQVVYAQVLDRDVEAPAPGLNGTASTGPPAVSIDISPLEPLPINGTVTMSLEDVVDTNMNEIPPLGVTVIITNESVTVTNHEVAIEETETETEAPEPSQVTVPFSPPAQSPLLSEEDSSGSGDGNDDDDDSEDGDDDGDDDDGIVVGDDDDEGED